MSRSLKFFALVAGGTLAFYSATFAFQQTSSSTPERSMPGASPRAMLDKYCVTCHNQKLRTAGLTLDTMNLDREHMRKPGKKFCGSCMEA